MHPFEFVVVLVSIIVGLGMTTVLTVGVVVASVLYSYELGRVLF